MKQSPVIRRAEDFDDLLPEGMPHNADAERAVIGSILLDNSLVHKAIGAGITAETFYVPMHAYVWLAYEVLAEQGQEIDPITLSTEMQAQGRRVDMDFISRITYGLPHYANIGAYAKTLLDDMGRRALIKIAQLVDNIARDREDNAGEVWKQAEALILEGASAYAPMRGHKKARERGFVHVAQDRPALRESLQNAYDGKSSGLATGIPKFDRMLKGGGLQPQGFYIFAARPKAGKTSLVLKIGDNIARAFAAQGVRRCVGIVSMEMSRLALIERRFSAFTKIPILDMSQAGFRGPQYERALASLDAFFDMPLYITDAIYNIPDLQRAGEQLVFGETQAAAIVVDYIQLAEFRKAQEAPLKDRYQVVSMVSRELKHMAQDWNVPVIGVSSINRLAPTENREPELHDLRESGQLEFDADAISFLVNAAWKPKMTDEEKLALDSAKVWDINWLLKAQRSGPTGTIPLKFLKKYTDYMTPEEFEAYQRGGRPAEPDFREPEPPKRPDEIPF
jgi:replicative DNA helicase